MPRGHRKRGAWHCKIWFSDGCRYELESNPGRTFTNADILNSVRKNLIPMLEAAVKAEEKLAKVPVDSSRGRSWLAIQKPPSTKTAK